MRISVDKSADALYISFTKKEDDYPGMATSTIIADGNVNIDYDKDGKLLGIEILSLNILDLNELKKLEYSENDEK